MGTDDSVGTSFASDRLSRSRTSDGAVPVGRFLVAAPVTARSVFRPLHSVFILSIRG